MAAAERDYRSIFENATVGIYRSAPDGRQLRANPALWRLNGYGSEAELLGDITDIGRDWYVDPARRDAFKATMERDDRVVNFESEIHRFKSRERIWIRENAWAVRDAAGNILFYEGLVEDITAEREASELRRGRETADRELHAELERSAARLRSFADIAADWHWESDADGRLTYISEGAIKVGIRPSEMTGRARDAFPAAIDQADPGFQAVVGAVARRETYKDIDYPIRHADGRCFIVSSSGTPQFDAAGAFLGYRGVGRDVTDQVVARQALALSESRFRDAIDAMSAGFLIWDDQDRLIAFNRAMLQVMPHAVPALVPGRSFAEINNAAVRAARPGASEEEIAAQLRERHAQRRREGTKDLHLRDGRIVEVTERRTSEGGHITTYRDVTALREAMRRLAEGEARLRDAIESMADGLAIWDGEDRLVAENRRVGQILPYDHADFPRGTPFVEAFRSAYRAARPDISDDELDRLLEARLATRRRYETGELRVPGDRIIEVTDRPTSDGGLITIYREVTEQRRTLRLLAESEARFRDFAETTADWFWEQDAELRFTYVSPSNETISGISAAAHVGLQRTETRKQGVTDAQWQAHLETLARHEPFRDFRYERIDPQGRRRHLSISGKPLPGPDGAFLGYRGVGKDETELVEAQRALEAALSTARAATEQEQRFATAVAHEFRTPLTIIDGAAQRLQRQLDDTRPEDMRARIGKIRSAVRSMEILIDTMLDSARLASGRLSPDRTRIDLVAFVTQQIRRFEPAITGREIFLASALAQAPISADARMLEHIVSNLLSNAIKYSGGSRRVDVTIDDGVETGTVALGVRDYGIGIPAEELPQLFTRFFRASTAKGIPGTGIGLNLVRELVQRHDGRIEVDSAVATGTRFTVTLPLDRAPMPAPAMPG